MLRLLIFFLTFRHLFQVLSDVSCNPFLHKAPAALFKLAASASSAATFSQSQQLTNIVDLRRKQDKLQQIQPNENLEDSLPSDEEMNTNEAEPSIIEKKINTILTKLKIISQASNIFNKDQGVDNPTLSIDFGEGFTTVQPNMEMDESHLHTTSGDYTDVEEISEQTLQKTIYPYSIDEPPIKFTLDIQDLEERNDTIESDTTEENQMNKFGQFGVFLAEILGTIVALAYGTALHINQFIEGTLSPPSTPE